MNQSIKQIQTTLEGVNGGTLPAHATTGDSVTKQPHLSPQSSSNACLSSFLPTKPTAWRGSHLVHAQALSCCSDCFQEFNVCAETSELFCLCWTIFDEAHRTKNPVRGFSTRTGTSTTGWSASRSTSSGTKTTRGEKLLKELREGVLRERLILRHLTVADVRRILKNIGRTDLNKNVALILRHGSEALYQRVEKLFSQAIEVEERIRQSHRHNLKNYPYYIFKIAESRRILCYIHMHLPSKKRIAIALLFASGRRRASTIRPSARDFAVQLRRYQ